MGGSLDGKIAIVTGASRGIGAAIARELAEQGAVVTLVGRDEAALAAECAAITAAGGAAPLSISRDLREPSAPADVTATVLDRFGRLDLLVNNAGATKRGDFLKLTDEDFADGFALKYYATMRFCRSGWPHLQASRGTILNIVGIGARTPAAEFTIGGSVNAAIVNFTKALADRGLADGVRVNALNPGSIVTDRLTRRIEVLAGERGIGLAEAEEALRLTTGAARFGRPEEIARVAAFLCGDGGSYVHGATIDVDGGATPGI